MNDLLPSETPRWQKVESALRNVLGLYAYQEIRLPILEQTELFARSIGSATDIVEKEMYSFDDRNGDSLALRPEGTAGCVRAAIQHGLFYAQPVRLWYGGPMFRHERPQKGRYRQFHQIGVEAIGWSEPEIDAELILMSARFWRQLGIERLELQINSLGTPETRRQYQARLTEYLDSRRSDLDEDSQRRLSTNPLRILDSKNPAMQGLIKDAPKLMEFLSDDARRHFESVSGYLDTAGIKYVVNPALVRGLDYYTLTVFEWVTDELGAQGAVCAGGRYDGLVEQLGGKPTPAAGFAVGLDRVAALLEAQGVDQAVISADVERIAVGDRARARGPGLAEALRDAGIRVQFHAGSGSMKSQMKRADKSGARFAILLGEDEIEERTITLKPLREEEKQISVAEGELIDCLRERIGH